jgi:DNA-directed RNA polymerase delta subunit
MKAIILTMILAVCVIAIISMIHGFLEARELSKEPEIPEVKIIRHDLNRCSQFKTREIYQHIRTFEFFIDFNTDNEFYVTGKIHNFRDRWELDEWTFINHLDKKPDAETERLAEVFLSDKISTL